MSENKKNILYVFGGEKAQGAEIVIERLMSYNAHIFDTHLLLSPGSFADQLRQKRKPYRIETRNCLMKLYRSKNSAFKFYLKALRNYLTVSREVYRYIKAHEIDVVHANTIVPASYMLPLIWLSPVLCPAVKWMWSDHDISYFSKIDHMLSSRCVSSYDVTLVVSGAVMDKYSEIGKVKVLYNGLDTRMFRPDHKAAEAFRKRYGYNRSNVILGMAGVVAPRKGQLKLITVFERLTDSFPNLRLLLAGDYESASPEYGQLVKGAIKSNADIKHLGYISNMVEFYNGCDIVISNSDLAGSEPLGTSIYEAMACEKLVVASDTGGTKEIITHETDGILFLAENEVALEYALKKLLISRSAWACIKKAARLKVKEKFNISTMARNYNTIVDHLNIKTWTAS